MSGESDQTSAAHVRDSEPSHQEAERQRMLGEERRVAAEQVRVEAEVSRSERERERHAAELVRAEQEQTRMSAERDRHHTMTALTATVDSLAEAIARLEFLRDGWETLHRLPRPPAVEGDGTGD